MPRRCAFGCPLSAVPMHRFPNPFKNCITFKKWVELVGGRLECAEDYQFFWKKKLICDAHFTDADRNRNKRINAFAVPSVLIPCTSSNSAATLVSVSHDTTGLSGDVCELPTSTDCFPDVSTVLPEHNYFKPQYNETKMIRVNIGKRINLERQVGNSKESSQSTIQKKDRPPTAKRKWDVTDDDFTFDDIDLNDQQKYSVESEPDDNCFAIDHGVKLDDFDNAIDISTDDNEKEDLDVEITGEIQNEKPAVGHTDFKCNVCHGDISGFRYSCVQCVDWDMCAACEARGEHPAHFVLRVPAPTPHLDCEPVIAGIREQIQHLLQLRKEIKSEIYIKEESDTDEITEDFDPTLTDPILVANDRSVPDLHMHQEPSTVDSLNTTKPSQETKTEGDTHKLDNTDALRALRNFLVKESTNSGQKQIRVRFKATRRNFPRHKVTQSLKEILKSVTNSRVIVQRQNNDR